VISCQKCPHSVEVNSTASVRSGMICQGETSMELLGSIKWFHIREDRLYPEIVKSNFTTRSIVQHAHA